MNKLPRSKTFFDVAEIFAERSTCLRGNVGAVIVQSRHIIAHGYNGAPSGTVECTAVGCDLSEPEVSPGPGWVKKWVRLGDWMGPTKERTLPDIQDPEYGCRRAIHAEENAILYAARMGVSCLGAVMYSTHEPCRQCAKMIAASGIVAVVWMKPYRLGASDYLHELGIITDREIVEQLA